MNKQFLYLTAIVFLLITAIISCKKEVAGVSLPSSIKLDVGETATLTATIIPENAKNKNVTWESDKPDVVTVDNGKITSIKEGKAIITATTVDGGKTAKCLVTVSYLVVSVTLDKTFITLEVNEAAILTATVMPPNAPNKNVKWESSNSNVAIVENGIVTGKAIGNAVITVTTEIGTRKATCNIRVYQPIPVEPEMVRVAGGTFSMGCPDEQGNDCNENEFPVHQVTLSSFYIGMYVVTQKEWISLMGYNPVTYLNWKGDELPINCINRNDAQTYIAKLNKYTGKNYRLPTEAEWEFAARGGIKSEGYKYSGSNNPDDVAWYSYNSNTRPHPIGEKQPNELGIYDMSGNVLEYCSDWYGVYFINPQTDPVGPESGSYHLIRGGSWQALERNCRVSWRGHVAPDVYTVNCTFRLVLSE